MYKNNDFNGFCTATLTLVMERTEGQTERSFVRDAIKALQTYHNTLPDGVDQPNVKEIIIV